MIEKTGRTELKLGDRVEVRHSIMADHHYKGLFLGGKSIKPTSKDYQYFSDGKGEYTLWFEMLEGTTDYEISK